MPLSTWGLTWRSELVISYICVSLWCCAPEYWSTWSAAFRLSRCALTSEAGLAAALNFMWCGLQLMQDTPQTLLGVKSHPSPAGDSAKKELPRASDACCLPPVKSRRAVRPQWWPLFSGYMQEPRKVHDLRPLEILARKSRRSLSAMTNKNFCMQSRVTII